MRPDAYDALVVGAGPAGSATAIRLARGGLRVAVLDRAEFPRRKPCGECLNPAAVRALDRLGLLEEVRSAGALPIRGWRIHPLAGSRFAGELPPGEQGLALPRDRFDAILLEAAAREGAEVRIGERVVDVLREQGQVTGVRTAERTIAARLVIGADGLRSVVLRRLGLLRRPPRLRKLALAAHVRIPEGRAGWGSLHLRPHGSVGVAEVSERTANIVVVLDSRHAGSAAGQPDRRFDACLRTLPGFHDAYRLDEVLATGPFDFPVRSAVADGALLVGDAAGYFDPFTGQGIFRALRGAELAAAAARDALSRGVPTAARLQGYEHARRRCFAPGERLQRIIEQVLARPGLFAAFAGLLARRGDLADALIETTSDIRTVRSLAWRVLLAGSG